MNISGIWAAARLTVLEALRSKILWVLAVFFACVLIASQFVEYLSLGEQAKIMKDLCLGLLSLCACFLAIVLPIEQMQKERQRNSLAVALVAPLHRYGFIAGKWMGLGIVVLMMVCMLSVMTIVALTMRGGVCDAGMIKAMVLVGAQGWILVSCSLLLGILLRNVALALVSGLGLYLMGNMLEPLTQWVEQASSLTVKTMALALFYLVPHLENLNVQEAVVLGEDIPWAWIAENGAYSLVYGAVVFCIAAIIFNQKDY